jgi:hypothetical protein
MWERICNSFALARSSWQVLKTDKKLVIFPILSGLACLLVFASFLVPTLLALNWFENLPQNQQALIGLPVAFAFYFCTYFVIIFFNAALMSCAIIRFNGGEPAVGDGLSAAASRLPQILAWALVSATVGMLLKAIENVHEKAGQIVSAILGTVWTVVTYFVVPVLVVEKLGPFAAISRSTQILKKTWGEALVGRFGIGFYMLLLALPGILLLIVGVMIAGGAKMAGLGIAMIVLAILYFLAWAAVGSALQGIFTSALYQYAAYNQVPNGFDQETMAGAFQPKS